MIGNRDFNTKGMTIGTVLLLVTVGTLAVFTMVAMAFFHTRFSGVVVNQRSARNIAESALATALTRVWHNPQYGEARTAAEFLHLPSTTGDGAEAFLAFNEAKANELGVPFSTNNFLSSSAVIGGNGRSVPDSAVHLVAIGKCRGAQYKAELLYFVPPYPNAMASTGPVISSGGLLVAAIPTVEEAAAATSSTGVDKSTLEAGHVVSNSLTRSAIQVGADSEIKGDVVAQGGIQILQPTTVAGEIRPNASEQPIPDIDVEGIFAKLGSLGTKDEIHDATLPNASTIDYFTEAKSPLTVRGDLILDGGVLFCRDDLTVEGRLQGQGAIFSLGEVRIESGADLSANDQIALVAKGEVELQGISKSSHFFNGLVYSEEEILANDVTIIGAAVVNGDRNSELHLNNVNLLKTHISAELAYRLPNKTNLSAKLLPPPASAGKDRSVIFGSSNSFFTFFTKERKSTSLSPPDARERLEDTLTAGIKMSGFNLGNKSGEPHYNLLFEGVFARGAVESKLNSEADLTDAEKGSLRLDDFPHEFRDGQLIVEYPRLDSVTREQAIQQFENYKSEITSFLDPPLTFSVTEKKKKRILIFKSSKSKTRSETVDPAAGLNIDVGSILDTIDNPGDEELILNLTLNRVLDAAESSRILLYQSF